MDYTDVSKEAFQYLENLRHSGVTNMYGATPYLIEWLKNTHYQNALDIIVESEAQFILRVWMENYEDLLYAGIIERR